MYARTSDLLSLPEKRGRGWLCLGVMWVLCVGAGVSSASPVAACLTSCLSVLCVCLWDTCTALLLVESAHGKAGAAFLGLGRDSGSPGNWAGLYRSDVYACICVIPSQISSWTSQWKKPHTGLSQTQFLSKTWISRVWMKT